MARSVGPGSGSWAEKNIAHARRLRSAAVVLEIAGTIMAGGGVVMTALAISNDYASEVVLGAMIVGAVLGLVVIGTALRLIRLARDVVTEPQVDPMPWGSRKPADNHNRASAGESAATWALLESMRADYHPADATEQSSRD